MKFLNDLLLKLYPPIQPIKPGLFSYRPASADSFPYPMHLRIESPEEALLILNSSTVLHLNQTAAEFLYDFMQGLPEEETVKQMCKRYQAPKEMLQADYADLFERLNVMMSTPDLDPVSFLDFERETPYSGDLSAPYRLDMALTYRYDDDGATDHELKNRVKQELPKEQWITLIKKSWKLGIPHLVFTGGEPTLCEFLPELIACAEENGQVTGLLTNGKKISDKAYLDTVLQAGLDHITVILDPNDECCWQAIQYVMPEDVFVTVHLTVTDNDKARYQTALEKLKQLEISSLSLSTNHADFAEMLSFVQENALYLGFSMVWDVPVPYSSMNPVSLEASREGENLESTGKTSLYLEPDGDVLKSQDMTEVLGNLLTDQWDDIWAKA